MTGTLALSSLIASLDRAGLTELVHARRIAAPASVKDPLDLAAELLKPDSISQALTQLSREELLFLLNGERFNADSASARAAVEHVHGLGLVGDKNVELTEVSKVLASLLASRGITNESLERAPADVAGVPSEPVDTSSWFASALTITGQSSWVLRDLARSPAKLNRNGDVASAWLRAVEERLSIPAVDEIVELLRSGSLMVPRDTWCVSHGDEWLQLEREPRWVALALAAVQLMPLPLREQLAGASVGTALNTVIATFPEHYPLATDVLFSKVDRAAQLWERVGITVAGHLSEPGIAALTGALDTAEGIPATELGLPDTAPGIYIQPDLSVVVPGPLSASAEAAVAAIALPEQLGVASTLRISEMTLSEAFHRGLGAEEIRELLGSLALTGIPQPVDYLITTLSERAGSIVVFPHFGEEGRARIEFARPELRVTVLVDRRLNHLQLREAEGDASALPPLFSRLRPDHVLAALLDARYPARGGGGLLTPNDARVVASQGTTDEVEAPAPSSRAADALDALLERVVASAVDGPTDISRQVTLAIRDKTRLQVTVEIRGDERVFTIVPVSLAAGRMRALDETAGVERTLPLDAITAVVQL